MIRRAFLTAAPLTDETSAQADAPEACSGADFLRDGGLLLAPPGLKLSRSGDPVGGQVTAPMDAQDLSGKARAGPVDIETLAVKRADNSARALMSNVPPDLFDHDFLLAKIGNENVERGMITNAPRVCKVLATKETSRRVNAVHECPTSHGILAVSERVTPVGRADTD
jgi:hypothetical protein